MDSEDSKSGESFPEIALSILENNSVYNLIPDSGKVVVFDSNLSVRHAFYGLVEHDIKCAPVWSSRAGQYLGMITVTDFIDILVYFHEHAKGNFLQELEDKTCAQWCYLREKHLLIQDSGEILKKLSESECIEGAWNSHQERIFSVSPDDSVLNAISVLNERNIHRLPIILKDPDNTVLCIINHQRILRFLLSKMQAKHSALMKKETIGDLKIGTYGPACPTANRSTKLIDILKLLKTHRVPAIVIVDEAGKYLDAYSRSDVRFLALDKSYDRLDITVEEALADHHSSRVIPTVRAEESLDIVFKRLLGTRKHATVLIDENDKVLGIISLSDIFGYLLSHRKS